MSEITPRVLQAIIGQYERTIDGMNARLGDLAGNLAIASDEMEALRARVTALEEENAALRPKEPGADDGK